MRGRYRAERVSGGEGDVVRINIKPKTIRKGNLNTVILIKHIQS